MKSSPMPEWWPRFLLWLFGVFCGMIMAQLVVNYLGMK